MPHLALYCIDLLEQYIHGLARAIYNAPEFDAVPFKIQRGGDPVLNAVGKVVSTMLAGTGDFGYLL